MAHEHTPIPGYTISDDPARLQVDAIHAFLTRCYWSEGIPRATVERAIRHSLCFGVYAPDCAQVGFARVITDRTTFAYLCDVYILEPHRGRGLSKALLRSIDSHPDLQGLRRFNLVTLDAHGLYAQFGFAVPSKPERYMERLVPDIYQKAVAPSPARSQ